MKKAIVIGAGIGGLSVAARLLAQGFEVEIFEKNHSIGGKTNFLKAGLFQFDLTASIMMFPDDYIDVFKFCNKDYKNYFSLIPLDKLYNVFYHDGSKYEFYSKLPPLCKTIDTITNNYTEDRFGYFNFLSSNYEKYLLAEDFVLNHSFTKFTDIIKNFHQPKLLKLASKSSSFEDASKYIKNEKLLDYLMFQTMYVGISPYTSPNIYNLIPTASEFIGLYHIKGGMYSYIKALEKLIIEMGGKINLLSSVDKILFQGNKAIGVFLKDEKHYSDIVVCSSDYSYSIDTLIPKPYLLKEKKDILKCSYSCSTFILYLVVDKKYPSLNIHNIFINKNFKENIDATFNGFLPEFPSLYIYCPSSIDDSICPEGYDTLNIMVRVPNLLYSKFHWNLETFYNLKHKILSTLTTIEGLEDILKHITYQNFITPLDFQNKFNTYGGTAFGLSHSLNQSVFFRPQCEIKGLKNLYFTGASIHPGNGVAMVLKSSKICSKKIYNKYKH